MKHHQNQFFKDGREYKDNIWEYFFKQPAGISIEDIKNTDLKIKIFDTPKSIVIENCTKFANIPLTLEENKNFKHREEFEEYSKYLNFSVALQEYLNNNYKKIVKDENEILGIICRGTDYINLRPKDHQIQPDASMLIREAKDLMKKFHYKKIYLATEDLNIYKEFQKEFKDILLPNTQYMYSQYENAGQTVLSDVPVNRVDHKFNLTREYILSIYILAKCKYLIGGRTAAAPAIYILSDFYKNMEYVHFWSRGKYKIGKKAEYTNFFQRIFSVKNEFYENKSWKVITALGIKFKFIKEIK